MRRVMYGLNELIGVLENGMKLRPGAGEDCVP